MKRIIVFQIHVILFLLLITSLVLNGAEGEFFKKNPMTLTPDPSFGKSVDWYNLFYDSFKNILVLPDGSMFVSNTHQDSISKFSPNGDLIGTYGQRGIGPGDLSGPKVSSILDGKLILIDEYALYRRFSLFDFNGKYVKVVKTKQSCFSAIALKDNHIAYYYLKYPPEAKDKGLTICHIVIKNITNGNEQLVTSFESISRSIKMGSGSISCGNTCGNPIINRTNNGNLIVGSTNRSKLEIYSIKGRLIQTVHLKISPIKVTPSYIKEFKNQNLIDFDKQCPGNQYDSLRKHIRNASYDVLFEDYLPLYNQFFIDSNGNILVFKYLESFDPKVNVMQVYRPDGQFVCETTIKTKGFKLLIDDRLMNIQFTDKGIFAVVEMDSTDDDTHVKLLKLNVQ